MTVASSGYTVVIMVTVDVLGFGIAGTLVASTEVIVLGVDGLGLEDSDEVCKIEVVDGSMILEEVLFDKLLVLLLELGGEATEAVVVGTAAVADAGGTLGFDVWVVLVG